MQTVRAGCAVKHTASQPREEPHQIMKWEMEGLIYPHVCQQCRMHPAECVPGKGHIRDEEMARVMVDYDVCIGCRSCVVVCPFGRHELNVIE